MAMSAFVSFGEERSLTTSRAIHSFPGLAMYIYLLNMDFEKLEIYISYLGSTSIHNVLANMHNWCAETIQLQCFVTVYKEIKTINQAISIPNTSRSKALICCLITAFLRNPGSKSSIHQGQLFRVENGVVRSWTIPWWLGAPWAMEVSLHSQME